VLLAAAAVLAGAAVQSATGFGFALLSGPALFALLDPPEAVGALSALGALMSVLVLLDSGRGHIQWDGLRPLLLAAVPGIGLGLLVLDALSKPALQIGVGVAVMAATIGQLARRDPGGGEPHAESAGAAAGVGLLSGTLTTSIGINGPPIVLLLEARGHEPRQVRATLAGAFLVLNALGFAALLAVHGGGEVAALGRLLPLLGSVIAGHLLGALAFRRLDARTFRVAVLGLALLSGAASAIAGFVSV
jgi:uncharacterized membrane protein YfcA